MNRGHSGAVLLICLMLLAALSLIGLAAASDHLLHEKISKNQVEGADARDHADSALRWGESWILGVPGDERPTPCATDCGSDDAVRTVGSFGGPPEFHGQEWWQSNAYAPGADPQSGTLLDAALNQGGLAFWLIEELHVEPAQEGTNPTPETAWYRVLARSGNTASGAYAVTESILARPWGDPAWTNGFPPSGPGSEFCYLLTPTVACGRSGWRQVH